MKKRFMAAAAALLLAAAVFCPVCFAAEDDTENHDDYVYSDGNSFSGEDGYSDEYGYSDGSGEPVQSGELTIEGDYVRARVIEIIEEVHDRNVFEGSSPDDYYVLTDDYQLVRLEVLGGNFKGQTVIAKYDLGDNWGGGNPPKALDVGDRVIAKFSMGADGVLNGMIMQYERSGSLIWLGVIFIFALILFGGKRGLRSILALVLTCVGLIFVMVPAMSKGMNPVLAAVLGSIFSIAVTLIIIYGFTIKTLAAALGSTGGVVVAGVVTTIMCSAMKMTGIIDEDALYLAQSAMNGHIDMRGILIGAIIISALGGTIDVAISIASSLDELKTNAPDITGAEMFRSGLNIGVDIMGASLNTLILAYVGGSIQILMLFDTYDVSMSMLLNDEMIAGELLQALSGSMGLLFTVPITSFVVALFMCRGNFGKFSAESFAATALFKKLCGKLDSISSERREKLSAQERREAEDLGIDDESDSLYAAVQKHMENMARLDESVDADYFGGLDDDGDCFSRK